MAKTSISISNSLLVSYLITVHFVRLHKLTTEVIIFAGVRSNLVNRGKSVPEENYLDRKIYCRLFKLYCNLSVYVRFDADFVSVDIFY